MREDTASAAVHAHELQLILVPFVVGVPEVTQPRVVAGDSLNKDVVVLAGGVVGAACAFLADNLGGEVVERPGVGTGP